MRFHRPAITIVCAGLALLTPGLGAIADPAPQTAVQIVAEHRDAIASLLVTNVAQDKGRRRRGNGAAASAGRARTETFDGSAFFITTDGYLITNNHMTERSTRVRVQLENGRALDGLVVDADAPADLALVKVTGGPYACLQLTDSDDVMPGEPVFMFGDDSGLLHSAIAGIVSGVHRNMSGPPTPETTNLIQLDIGANEGLSGAPCLNAYGQVMGVHHMGDDNMWKVNYCIPSNTLRKLIPRFMDPARINGVNVGIHLTEKVSVIHPATIVSHLQCSDDPGRVIRAINGQAPRDLIDACHMLLAVKAGDCTRLEFTDGSMRSIPAMAVDDSVSVALAKSVLGLGVAALTPSLAELQHITAAEGVDVEQVQPGGLASGAGVRTNDVILQLGSNPTLTPAQLAKAIKLLPATGTVSMGVIRGGRYLLLSLRLPAATTRPE